MKTRPEAFRSIENNAFDVCVVGGGATGAGCALDAQLRGLRTVLLEGETLRLPRRVLRPRSFTEASATCRKQ